MRSFIAAVLICSAAPAFGKTVFGVKSISSGLGPTFVIAQNNRSAIAGAYRNGFSGAGFSGAQGQASALPSIPSSIACTGNELDCFPVPSGLTSHGNVVGYFSGLNPQTQIRFNDIFTWQPGDASLSNIVTVNPNSYQTCDISCHPAYLNNSGMIAYNTSDNGSGVPGAVFGRAGGTVQPIPGLASTAFITGLTNTNLVVGLVQLNSSSYNAFFTFQGGVLKVHQPPGTNGLDLDVVANDKGDIAGSYTTAGVTYIFERKAGQYSRFAVPEAISYLFSISAINNNGRIVGTYSTGKSPLPFLFNGAEFTPIAPALLPPQPLGTVIRVLINDENRIIYSWFAGDTNFGSYRIVCSGSGC